MAIKGFEILLWFLIIPLAAGNLPVLRQGRRKTGLCGMADALICGYVLLFAVFELLALPLILPGSHLQFLKYSYENLSACWLWQESSLPGKIKEQGRWSRTEKRAFHEKKFQRPCGFAFLLVAIQMGAYVLAWQRIWMTPFMWQRQPRLWRRTGCSRTMPIPECWHRIFRRDMCFAPFPIPLAFYSDMVHMHAAVVAHTVEPVFFLLISILFTGRSEENCLIKMIGKWDCFCCFWC